MIDAFWFFMFYSFFGFLLEIVFSKLAKVKKRDRKCRYLLPVCPVYGFGVLLLISLPEPIHHHLLLLFFLGALIASVIEFVIGIFYSRILHVSFWNYTKIPYNLHGQICLYFSLAWGGLSILLIYGLQPLVATLVTYIPLSFFLPVFYLFLVDTTLSMCLLHHFQTTEILCWYRSLSRLVVFSSSRRTFLK